MSPRSQAVRSWPRPSCSSEPAAAASTEIAMMLTLLCLEVIAATVTRINERAAKKLKVRFLFLLLRCCEFIQVEHAHGFSGRLHTQNQRQTRGSSLKIRHMNRMHSLSQVNVRRLHHHRMKSIQFDQLLVVDFEPGPIIRLQFEFVIARLRYVELPVVVDPEP